MRKKIIFVLSALAFIFTGCNNSGMIDEMKALTIENIRINEHFKEAIISSKSGRDIAAAIDKYGDATAALAKRSKELEKRYPSILEKSDYPELQGLHTKTAALSSEISGLMGSTLQKYKNDADVTRAMNDLAKKLLVSVNVPGEAK